MSRSVRRQLGDTSHTYSKVSLHWSFLDLFHGHDLEEGLGSWPSYVLFSRRQNSASFEGKRKLDGLSPGSNYMPDLGNFEFYAPIQSKYSSVELDISGCCV